MADGEDSICDCLRTLDACFEALLNSSITGDAFYCKNYSEQGAAVAQRVGRWTRDQQVVGSNPRASRG